MFKRGEIAFAGAVTLIALAGVAYGFMSNSGRTTSGMGEYRPRTPHRTVSPKLARPTSDPEERHHKVLGMNFGFNHRGEYYGKHSHHKRRRADEHKSFVAQAATRGSGIERRKSMYGVDRPHAGSVYDQWHQCRHQCIASNQYTDPGACVNECDNRFVGSTLLN
jgi:hypothetical protein